MTKMPKPPRLVLALQLARLKVLEYNVRVPDITKELLAKLGLDEGSQPQT